MMDTETGMLLVLSGPSGVGKGTVCAALRSMETNIVYSVSATTRAPRQGEREGANYFFKTREAFERMIEQDELLEWAEYAGNYYGTPRSFVRETIEQGKDIILEIEVQGAMKVKKKFPEAIFIFLAPPSMEELRHRIEGRGTETEEVISHRLTIASDELALMQEYDYVVVNDEVNNACNRIQSIITAEHCKRERVVGKYRKWF